MKPIFHHKPLPHSPAHSRNIYAHKMNYSIFLASTERSELDETIEKTFRGIKMEQNHLLRGNQYFTFCSHAEFSKNGIILEHFGNKTGKTGTILFQPTQNPNRMQPLQPAYFQCMNQGNIAWQCSSSAVHSRYHPLSMKLLIAGSFSLLRFFWRSKRNEEKLSSEPELKPCTSNTDSPAAELNMHIWQHFGNKKEKTGTILFQAAQKMTLPYYPKHTLSHYRNLSRCGGISTLSHFKPLKNIFR